MKKTIFLCLLIMFGGFMFAVSPLAAPTQSVAAVSAAEVSTTAPELNEESEESNFFREKVMPYITANVSSIISAVIIMLTTLGKIKAATTELKAATIENASLKKKNKQLEERIAKLEEKVENIDKNTTDTKEMVKIGFCNTAELVQNGYAEEIAKVGENEEETES